MRKQKEMMMLKWSPSLYDANYVQYCNKFITYVENIRCLQWEHVLVYKLQ